MRARLQTTRSSHVISIFTIVLTWCWAGSAVAEQPVLVSVQKIWDKAAHSAFPDLTRFGNRWYCVFREGTGHVGDCGSVRVLTSGDGETWQSVAELRQESLDLRDPKITVTPDGRLMLLMGITVYGNDGQRLVDKMSQLVAFSNDGSQWERHRGVLPRGHWLWRVTWNSDVGYGFSKVETVGKPKRGFLWKTADGRNYTFIHEFNLPGMTETTFRQLPDSTMLAVTRYPKTGLIGTSRPPYREWTWTEAGRLFGGPNWSERDNGELWATSRLYNVDDPKNGPRRTALFSLTRNSITPALILPSGGDTGYAGMVWHDDLLWLSYYSSHEERTSIYLAKIRFE